MTSQLQDEPPTDHYVLTEESVVVPEAPNEKPHTEKLTTLSDVTHGTPVVTADGNDAPSVTLESARNLAVTEVQRVADSNTAVTDTETNKQDTVLYNTDLNNTIADTEINQREHTGNVTHTETNNTTCRSERTLS